MNNYSIKIDSVNVSSDVIDLIKHVTHGENKVVFAIDINGPQKIEIHSIESPISVKKNNTQSYDHAINLMDTKS